MEEKKTLEVENAHKKEKVLFWNRMQLVAKLVSLVCNQTCCYDILLNVINKESCLTESGFSIIQQKTTINDKK